MGRLQTFAVRAPSVAPLVLLLLLAACAERSGGVKIEGGGSGGGEGRKVLSKADLIPEGIDPTRVTLGPSDLLEIRVYQEPEMSGKYRISQEGSIEFPLVGTVKVAGLTTSQLERAIRDQLEKGGFLHDASVTCVLLDGSSQKVFILGQVAKPNAYLFEAGMTIVQLVSMAGGFTANAARNSTTVTRLVDGREMRIVVPVEDISLGRAANFVLIPNDIVYIPDSWM